MTKTLKNDLQTTPEGRSQLVTAELQRQYEDTPGPRSVNQAERDRVRAAVQVAQGTERKPA